MTTPSRSEGPAVAFESVTHAYGDSVAVRGVDLAIERGEFFALLGPSGSGKTTLLMLIAGFERATSGAMRLDGRLVSDVPAHLRNIGVVFQDYALFPHLTVWDNIDFPLRSRGLRGAERRERVAWALDLVQLGGRGASLPSQLSGGQQQRVALARALVFGPDVLLMDEPLGALDRAMREEMKVELKRIQRELGVTVVYVTHDQSEAMAMADRVGVMHEGRLQQVAPPEDLYSTPATPFIARFVGDAALLDATVDGAGTVTVAGKPVAHQPWTGGAGPIQLAVRPAGAQVSELTRPSSGRPVLGLIATVDATAYLGASWRVTVRLPDGQLAQGSAESGPFVRGLTPGDPVRIVWPADAATPLAPAPADHPAAPLPQK